MKIFEPHREKSCLMPYANNLDTDQPVHLCNLISIFVVHSLDSIIPVVAIFYNFKTLANF